MTRPVKLRIDRLVLNGTNPKDRTRLVAALQAELRAQLAGFEPATGHRVESAKIVAPGAASPATTGRQAATVVARQVKGGGS